MLDTTDHIIPGAPCTMYARSSNGTLLSVSELKQPSDIASAIADRVAFNDPTPSIVYGVSRSDAFAKNPDASGQERWSLWWRAGETWSLFATSEKHLDQAEISTLPLSEQAERRMVMNAREVTSLWEWIDELIEDRQPEEIRTLPPHAR